MSIEFETLPAGTKVIYRSNSGATRRGTVEDYDEDIKNGRPGYDFVDGGWCYSDQIVRVLSARPV